MLPERRLVPLRSRCASICLNIAAASWYFFRRRRKLRMVASSKISSNTPSYVNWCITGVSRSPSSMAGSPSTYHYYSKWIHSMVSSRYACPSGPPESGLRIIRLDERQQYFPQHTLPNLEQEDLALRACVGLFARRRQRLVAWLNRALKSRNAVRQFRGICSDLL